MDALRGRGALLTLTPMLLSLWTAVSGVWWLALLAVGALLVAVEKLPWCHGRETEGLFVLGFFTLLPIHVRIAWAVGRYFAERLALYGVGMGVVVFLMLTSAAEIVLALLSRFIWPRQRDSFPWGKERR